MKRFLKTLVVVIAPIFFLAPPGFSQSASSGDERPGSRGAAASAPAAIDESRPVPVPEPGAKALEFYRTGNGWWIFNQFWAIVVPGVLAFSGASARLRDLARRLSGGWFSEKAMTDELEPRKWSTFESTGSWFFTVGVYVVLYLAVVFLINLPLSFYLGYMRLHAYDLSNQTFGKWFGDKLIALGVSMAVGFALTWVPYGIMHRSPRRWWLYTGLLSVPFLLATMLVKPIWIDPLFNTFGPMKNKALEGSILALAERAGIGGSRVFEVEKSIDTKAVNAYVTGVLGTKRIVLWDTLLRKLDEPEVLAVMGHEMGHYVMGHVVRSILLGSLVVIAGLYFVHVAGRWLIGRHGQRLGFDRLADIASVPLVLMLIEVSSLFLSPVVLAYSRYQEHEADWFALGLTRANHSAGMAFVKMQAENLGNPRPGLLYRIFRASHPSIGERIDFCNDYHPWRPDPPAHPTDPRASPTP